jgi:hypothetical protein
MALGAPSARDIVDAAMILGELRPDPAFFRLVFTAFPRRILLVSQHYAPSSLGSKA